MSEQTAMAPAFMNGFDGFEEVISMRISELNESALGSMPTWRNTFAAPEVLNREGERERLRYRLHREEALRVASLHRFAAGRRAAHGEELRRRQRELRYIVRRLAVRGHHTRDVHNFVEKSFIKCAVLHFMRSSFAARRAIFLFCKREASSDILAEKPPRAKIPARRRKEAALW